VISWGLQKLLFLYSPVSREGRDKEDKEDKGEKADFFVVLIVSTHLWIKNLHLSVPNPPLSKGRTRESVGGVFALH
jgi:hypothetical protein